MQHNPLADEVWRDLSRLVLDNKDRWRRAVVDRDRPAVQPDPDPEPPRPATRLTVKEVAAAATMDAPAATVAVNDLEDRGLVVREVDPHNRRSKLVSLTDAGRRHGGDHRQRSKDPAPEQLCDLDDARSQALQAITRSRLRGLAQAGQHRHRGIVPADTRYRAAATRT